MAFLVGYEADYRAHGDPLWYQREPLAPEDALARKFTQFPTLDLMVWQTYTAPQVARKIADLYDTYQWRADSVPKTPHLRAYIHYALERRKLFQLGTKKLIDKVIRKIQEKARERGPIDPRPLSQTPGDKDADPRKPTPKPNLLR
jgi:hypothetical protein